MATITAWDHRKCLDSRVLSKTCSSSQSSESRKEADPELYQNVFYTHDCSKNHKESSGPMKASSIVECFIISESKPDFTNTFLYKQASWWGSNIKNGLHSI